MKRKILSGFLALLTSFGLSCPAFASAKQDTFSSSQNEHLINLEAPSDDVSISEVLDEIL